MEVVGNRIRLRQSGAAYVGERGKFRINRHFLSWIPLQGEGRTGILFERGGTRFLLTLLDWEDDEVTKVEGAKLMMYLAQTETQVEVTIPNDSQRARVLFVSLKCSVMPTAVRIHTAALAIEKPHESIGPRGGGVQLLRTLPSFLSRDLLDPLEDLLVKADEAMHYGLAGRPLRISGTFRQRREPLPKDRQPNSDLLNLPEEVLMKAIGLLTNSDLAQIAQTCRMLRSLTSNENLLDVEKLMDQLVRNALRWTPIQWSTYHPRVFLSMRQWIQLTRAVLCLGELRSAGRIPQSTQVFLDRVPVLTSDTVEPRHLLYFYTVSIVDVKVRADSLRNVAAVAVSWGSLPPSVTDLRCDFLVVVPEVRCVERLSLVGVLEAESDYQLPTDRGMSRLASHAPHLCELTLRRPRGGWDSPRACFHRVDYVRYGGNTLELEEEDLEAIFDALPSLHLIRVERVECNYQVYTLSEKVYKRDCFTM